LVRNPKSGGDFQIGPASRCQQHNLGSFDLSGRKRARTGPLFQGFLLGSIQHD
jgi:hypothetical protein